MEEIQTWFYMTEPINFISLYVNYQSYSYTRSIAESIKRASPGCMRSTPSSQRLHQQVTMALMQLCQRHSSMYTSCNRMYFICLWTQLSYVKLLLWCCFAVQYPSQSVWAPCFRNFDTFDVKLYVIITVCLPVFFELSGPRNLLKTVCAIDRLRKHCYHSVSFPVVVWSPWVTCLSLHKHLRIHVRCSALSPKLILKPLFIFLSFSVKHKVLVYCSCKYFKIFTDWRQDL